MQHNTSSRTTAIVIAYHQAKCIGANAFSLFVFFTGKWSNPFQLSQKTWLFLALSGIATGASWVFYFRALKVGDASKVAPVDKLSLLLVAVFAFWFLDERPNLREWIGILMVAEVAIFLGPASPTVLGDKFAGRH